MKILVIEENWFIAPGGEVDEGGVKKFISEDPTYLECSKLCEASRENCFFEHKPDEVQLFDDCHSTDGYNRQVKTYKAKVLYNDEAEIMQREISAYEKIKV